MATYSLLTGLTGAVSVFSIPFDYLSKSHVYVYVNGAPASFSWNSTYSITITPAPVGTAYIYRSTPNGQALRSFTDGSVLLADDLNTALLQSLFVSQETSEYGLKLGSSGAWDAAMSRIANVADPANATDAANKQWVESFIAGSVSAAAGSATAAAGSASAASGSASSALTSKTAAETAAAQATALVAGVTPMFARNLLLNGNFDFWQRGTSQTTNGVKSADRWSFFLNSATRTASRQAFAVGQTAVPGNPRYFVRHNYSVTLGFDYSVGQTQFVEDVRLLSGKRVTYSFWIKASASCQVAVEGSQFFGTGGSPSAAVYGIGVQKLNVTTSWQKFSVLIDVPSISGKTLGTNNDHHFGINLWFDAGSNYDSRTGGGFFGLGVGTIDVARCSLVEGDVTADADPMYPLPYSLDLHGCRRYYEKSYDLETVPGSAVFNGAFGMRSALAASIFTTTRFLVPKRVTPILTVYSPGTGASGVIRNASSNSDITSSVTYLAENGYVENAVGASSAGYAWHFVADAEF